MAVTNCPLTDIAPPVSVTSSTYCSPHSRFWLSLHGLEDPAAPLLLLEFVETVELSNYDSYGRMQDWRVEFEYDGGRYIGTHCTNLNKAKMIATRLGIPAITSFVFDISSF